MARVLVDQELQHEQGKDQAERGDHLKRRLEHGIMPPF